MARKKWYIPATADAAGFRKWWPPLPPLPPQDLLPIAAQTRAAPGSPAAKEAAEQMKQDSGSAEEPQVLQTCAGAAASHGGEGDDAAPASGGEDVEYDYELEVMDEEWKRELEELEPKKFSERPRHPVQENWVSFRPLTLCVCMCVRSGAEPVMCSSP
jgi:hypothetical protein